jgi:phosphoribosylcarboxyaminoimidazole (NCAIR) mutase
MKKSILIVCGSDSDLPQVLAICESLPWKMSMRIDVISCHRNPEVIRRLAKSWRILRYRLVICIGGKAFALPGVLDSWIHYYKRFIPVAGVALGAPGSKSLLAAQLSITEIPGQTVLFDRDKSEAYTGPDGLMDLLRGVEAGGYIAPVARKEKPALMNVWNNFKRRLTHL